MNKEEIIIRLSELDIELVNHDCEYQYHTDIRGIKCSVCDNYEQSAQELLGLWKECQHLDYTDTLDGAVCNDCNLEVGGEE